MLVDDLMQQIFEGRNHTLSASCKLWLESSRRFREFAEAYATKIRKKARIADEHEKLLDLCCELETAYCLLQDRKFELVYEKKSGSRAPDFAVMFRTHTPCNIEVTRHRSADDTEASTDPTAKFMETLCDKVGQMPTGEVNVLVIYAPDADRDDLVAAANNVRLLSERKDEDYFTRRGFKDARTFIRQFQNLGAVVLKTASVFIWTNSLAKKPLPNDLHKALQRVF